MPSSHSDRADSAHPHSHAHAHGHHDHGHDHDHGPAPGSTSAGDLFSLYGKIDRDNVVALNADGGEGMGRKVIKTWDGREDEIEYLQSDSDDSLILLIPFTAQVKLRSMTIKTGPGGMSAGKVLLYTNDMALDFNSVTDRKPAEEINLVTGRGGGGVGGGGGSGMSKEGVEYAVRPSKFSALRSLQLYFPNNVSSGDDEEVTRIYYVGLKGEWSELTKNPDGIIVYEANANPADHKVKGMADLGSSRMGH